MDTNLVLGVDAGGTKVRFGLVRDDGGIVARAEYPSHPQPAREWTKTLIRELDAFLSARPSRPGPAAIGIGMRGSIDHRRQLVRFSSIVRNEEGYDIRSALEAHYRLPAFLENDVKASATAELLFGIGKTTDTFACVNVGTGLAMGVVYEGKLLHGIHNDAGEIGNSIRERADANGEIVCLETVSSGQGLELEAERLRASFPESALFAGGQSPSSRQIVAACRAGDPLARKAAESFFHHLAITLINLDAALDLGSYVLVGGTMSDPWMVERLIEEIRRVAAGVHYRNFRWNAEVRCSALGADLSGLRGAGGVAFYALRDHHGRPEGGPKIERTEAT